MQKYLCSCLKLYMLEMPETTNIKSTLLCYTYEVYPRQSPRLIEQDSCIKAFEKTIANL